MLLLFPKDYWWRKSQHPIGGKVTWTWDWFWVNGEFFFFFFLNSHFVQRCFSCRKGQMSHHTFLLPCLSFVPATLMWPHCLAGFRIPPHNWVCLLPVFIATDMRIHRNRAAMQLEEVTNACVRTQFQHFLDHWERTPHYPVLLNLQCGV